MNVGEDKLLVQEDIDFFKGDIGLAQVYLVSAVYTRLKALHPDIKFMVVPWTTVRTATSAMRPTRVCACDIS